MSIVRVRAAAGLAPEVKLRPGKYYAVLENLQGNFRVLDEKSEECLYTPNCFDYFEDDEDEQPSEEYTGSSVNYYTVDVQYPTNSERQSYTAECNDIIEALGMNYAEGNAFKAIWRSCAARNLGKNKKGYDEGLYDAEKVVFFGTRMVEMAKQK